MHFPGLFEDSLADPFSKIAILHVSAARTPPDRLHG